MHLPQRLDEAVLEKLARSPSARIDTLGQAASDERVLVVESLPGLLQAYGYLKYLFPEGGVFLRGQARWYANLDPSLYRQRRPGGAVVRRRRSKTLGDFIAESSPWECQHAGHSTIDCPERLRQQPRSNPGFVSAGTPRYAAEGLLQHYGIRTRWLDVVDNLWVALWFGCHDFVGQHPYAHVVRRVSNADAEVYIAAFIVEGQLRERHPGLYIAAGAGRVLDLRKAVPSFYLRPHAQHAWLLRPRDDNPQHVTVVPIRVPLRAALDWLGDSLLLSAFGLFPPASVDIGYRKLLAASARVEIPEVLGGINVIGPGY